MTTIDPQLAQMKITLPSFVYDDNAKLDVLAYVIEPTNKAVIVRSIVLIENTSSVSDTYYLYFEEKISETSSKTMCIDIEKEGLVTWGENNRDIIQIHHPDFLEIITCLKEEISQ